MDLIKMTQAPLMLGIWEIIFFSPEKKRIFDAILSPFKEIGIWEELTNPTTNNALSCLNQFSQPVSM